MNKNVTKLLATAMVVGLIAGGSAMANEGAHPAKKAAAGKDGCKGKEGCHGKDKHAKGKHDKKEAGGTTTTTTTTEEAPAKAE